MACFHPLDAFQSLSTKENGKRHISFKWFANSKSIKLPCGQCIGCRLERSRQWAIRCIHEASLYEDNCFITLTYNDQHKPDDDSLDVRHFQLFMKRLRKRFGAGIRFFHCGEYGETFGRPHYHACLFNFDFQDKVEWKRSNGVPIFTSDSLSELWPYGFSTVGSVTFESAAYVARYILKKVNGDLADDHYFDSSTGVYRKPEYTTMSRRPGIGKGWFDKYSSDVFPSDFVVINGTKMRPPKYYDRQFEIVAPDEFEEIRDKRERSALVHVDNNTPDRLKVRETVQLRRLEKLPRTID